MKIIEGLKDIKALTKKAHDLREKVSKYHADFDHETSAYPNQRDQVAEWVQSHHDTVKRILALKHLIKKTNIQVPVTITLGGVAVTRSISEWIDRRRELVSMEKALYASMNDRGLQEGTTTLSNGEKIVKKIRRHYDAQTRDKKLDEYNEEPHLIDAQLEIKNAVTDLIE